MMLSLGACGKVKEDEYTATQQESSMQVGETVDLEINANEDTVNMDSEIKNDEDINTENSSPLNQQESSPQVVESVDEKMTSEELLDLFKKLSFIIKLFKLTRELLLSLSKSIGKNNFLFII